MKVGVKVGRTKRRIRKRNGLPAYFCRAALFAIRLKARRPGGSMWNRGGRKRMSVKEAGNTDFLKLPNLVWTISLVLLN